ncbi:MAG: hypothetical protein R2697_16050 [Ilumatobacteraceae bacterium]
MLFTIRTYVTPLTTVLADPDDREAITRIIDAMPDDVRFTKTSHRHHPHLVG